MEVGKWKMAQRWRHFKRPASSKGMWKEFVKDQARLYEPIPSFVVPEFDELSPKEERYYQQGPFSTDEVFLGSEGGRTDLDPAQLTASKELNLQQQYLKELMTEIKKLAKDPKYKTWQAVEKELIKKFNKPPYNISSTGRTRPFYNSRMGFNIPVSTDVYGKPYHSGVSLSKPKHIRGKLRNLIGVELIQKNPNFSDTFKALKEFYTKNPKSKLPEAWKNLSEAEAAKKQNLIKTFNRKFLGGSQGYGQDSFLRRYFQTLDFNFKNKINPNLQIKRLDDLIRDILKRKDISPARRKFLEKQKSSFMKIRSGIIEKLKSEIPNLFGKKGSGAHFEHLVARATGNRGVYLPNDYIARGTYAPGNFNWIKSIEYEKDLLNYIDEWYDAESKDKKAIEKKIRNHTRIFNNKTKVNGVGYLDNLDFKFGKNSIRITDSTPILSSYKDIDVLNQLDKNIKHSNAYFKSKGDKEIFLKKTKLNAKDAIIKGPRYDKFLAFKENIRTGGGGVSLKNFAGAIDLDGLDLTPFKKGIGKIAPVLKVTGLAAAPLNVIPFAQQMEKGMGIRSVDTGAARLLEDFINMPKFLAQLVGKDLPYEERTFGRKYADKVASEMGEEKILANIDQLFAGSEKIDDPMYDALGEYSFAARTDDRQKVKDKALTPFFQETETETTPFFQETETETEEVELDPISKRAIGEPQLKLAKGGTVPRSGYKIAKKAGSLFKKVGAPFEAGFIVTDYYNNRSRGMSKEEAWQTALSNATFGIYEGGSRAKEKGLIDLAEAQGYSDWQVDSLKTMMSYKKLEDELRSEKAKLKWLMGEQESDVGSITGEDTAGQIEQQKDLISQMEKGVKDLGDKYWETIPEGEDFNTGKMFDDLLGYKARQEYNENVEARKHRVNPDMGEIGSPLWEALSDWKTYLPQNLMETTQATQPVVRNLRKLPGILGSIWDPTSEQAILSAMTPEEREERAAKLNIKRQTYDPMHETSTMTYDQMDPYYADFEYMFKAKGGRVSYLDGGIVSLLKK